MDRKLIGTLSLLGVVMGVVSVLGWTQHREGIMWLVVAIASAVWIALKAPGKFFAHGFWTGLLCGMIAPLIQFVMLPTYLANNPDTAAQMQTLPAGWNPRVMLLVSAPILGLASGAILGLLSFVAAKMMRRSPPAG